MTVAENEEAWTEIRRWGRNRELNELDALMWRTERHPGDSWTGVVVELLDSMPDWETARAAFDYVTRAVPRFRQRVVDPALPVGPPVWVTDERFDLGNHVRHIRLPQPGTMRQLLDWAQEHGVDPLDRRKPPWMGTLVDGLEGGRAAFVFKAQHVLMDGTAATELFSRIMSPGVVRDLDKLPPEPAAEKKGTAAVTAEVLLRQLRGAQSFASRLAHTLPGALADPVGGARYAASLRRVLAPPQPPQSQLLGRGTRTTWRFGTLECGVDELKAAAHAAGGTLNDAFVASVLGGLRHYHERVGLDLGDIPISMPVSVRRAEDDPGGNRFTGAFFSAPSGIADPRERIAAMRQRVESVRGEPALDFLGALTPLLNRAPAAIVASVLSRLNAGASITTSSWRGVANPVDLAGSRFDRMFVFGPLPGTSLTAALCSHVGVCCIGLNADADVFEDTDALWESMQLGLEEVLALGRPQPTKSSRARSKSAAASNSG